MKRFAQLRQVFSFYTPPERTTLSSELSLWVFIKKPIVEKYKTILICIHFLLALFKWKAISLY
jgi:hypothetical protein